MATQKMVVEFDQRSMRVMERVAKALEAHTKATQSTVAKTNLFEQRLSQPEKEETPDLEFYAELAPGVGLDSSKNVIQWDGTNFYRFCGAGVGLIPNSHEVATMCVLPKGHGGSVHVDWDGASCSVIRR